MLVFTALAQSETVPAAQQNLGCLKCHEDYAARFAASVHGNFGCVSCHTGITNLMKHAQGEQRPAPARCGNCHKQPSENFRRDFHYVYQGFTCTDCHRGIHGLKARKGDFKTAVINTCTTCHPQAEYAERGHGRAVLRGNSDSAACSDCHGLHGIPSFHAGRSVYPAQARVFYSGKCVGCHADAELMKRNGLSASTVKRYEGTYHGKVRLLGYPEQVAGCADCHHSHNTLRPDDPRSVLSAANLGKTCGECHSGFQPRFVKFIAHPDYENRKAYPALYFTYIFMALLIISVFAFFWTHTALWWRKAFWEKYLCKREAAAPECDGEYVERFGLKYIVMHVILIISFLTLVLTGVPLKYGGRDWARTLVGLWGGAPQAGYFHRAAAFVLIVLFLYTVWLSLKFLFPGGKVKGWVGGLLGPDSLFPNLKDWADIKAMFRWFFNRGEMPQFDRWTYWEKFDFFAVFWGMFAIGLSGLMLWFPEKLSYIFPGWFINIATIVHSEEALLAALFIFTVHFFNNHLVPNKFPLEKNILTGRNSLEQLRTERPLEYGRLVASAGLSALKRPAPSKAAVLFAVIFGLASVLIGLFITVLLIWALVF